VGAFESATLPKAFLVATVGNPLARIWELVPAFHVSAKHGPIHDVTCRRTAAREHDDVLPIGNELAIAAAKQPAGSSNQRLGVIGVSSGGKSDAGRTFRVGWPRRDDFHGADPLTRGVAKGQPIADPRAQQEFSRFREHVGVWFSGVQPLHANDIRSRNRTQFVERERQGALRKRRDLEPFHMDGKDAIAGVNFEINASSLRARDFGSHSITGFDESERYFNLASNRSAAWRSRRRLHPMKEVLRVSAGDGVLGDRVKERHLKGGVVSHRNGVWWNHAFGAFCLRVRVTAIRCILRDRQASDSRSPDQWGFDGSDRR